LAGRDVTWQQIATLDGTRTQTPFALVHGDLKFGNLDSHPDGRTVHRDVGRTATFADNPARSTPYLVAGPGMFEGEGFAATTLVTTDVGTGLLLFQATHETISTDTWISRCSGPDAKGECRTGPHGERIQVMDFGPDSAGVWGRTIIVYSGQTTILAGARNAPESDNSRPTMTEPPLTVVQLLALACDPALVLFP
jgi:hypothetical protein